ncbi:ribonuclease H1 [Hypoxylon rubiginosum]|uniref:Ribonuclease H1 n=1 Tax=Hypoxylon rubiginosum TaxID=110542 RepID=A0ACB9YID9_9PEZI|nr:ribonuclease H1 [Hypoxylon rubiginosum]
MVYTMEFRVDGGCRGNGTESAIGAAAACRFFRGGSHKTRTQALDTYEYNATNQRAEILAMTIALDWVLEKFKELNSYPRLRVKIYSDSRYAIGCMNEWIAKWSRNGWRNSQGKPVANRDLIEEASLLNDAVKELGTIRYIYIPREENMIADAACNDALDELEDDDDLTSTDSSTGFYGYRTSRVPWGWWT